ncbi:MAG: Hsp20/alpha crystallin family protein [Promethearchaeota archaeon]
MPDFLEDLKNLAAATGDVTSRITKKLNRLLADQQFVDQMRDYYFEPVLNEDGEEEKYVFTNPFNNKAFTFKWDPIHGKPVLIGEEHDEETLEEFHNALEHLVAKQREHKRKQTKQFLDFFEDDLHLKVILEIPESESGDDIDVRATPYELEVMSGRKFHRKIKLSASISPISGKATFHPEENILEITFRKSPRLSRKRKIKIRKSPQ